MHSSDSSVEGPLQLQLDDASMPYVTVNTRQGLWSSTGPPFGVASAPAIFQKMMETVLQGLRGVLCYIDDTGEWQR